MPIDADGWILLPITGLAILIATAIGLHNLYLERKNHR